MKFFSSRMSCFVLVSSFLTFVTPKAVASKSGEDREVRISYVEGDVRLSRGAGHHIDLNQSWEKASDGDLLEQGYALATGDDGRAEIEFEDGSTVFLARNSLLLFRDFSSRLPTETSFDGEPAMRYLLWLKGLISPGDHVISRMTLATGTATFALQPTANESFFIDTPTDKLELSPPETFFGRIDAYLDATAITPQEEKGDRVVRRGAPPFQIRKWETVFFQGGEILETANRNNNDVAAMLAPYVSWESLLPGLPDSRTPPEAESIAERSQATHGQASKHTQELSAWDAWVLARVQQRRAVTAAALKASGLSSPIPGLADLYEHGTFFSCEPYGTCWEPTESEAMQENSQQSPAPSAQSRAPAQASPPFQPQTVQWEELWQGWCSPPALRTVTRVAHTRDELQKLLQVKAAAQNARYSQVAYPSDCENGYWIPRRGHFARVLTPQAFKPICSGKKCKPIHPPHPLWVKVNGKVGFVLAHPNDVKGKPPINLKGGILIPPSRPGGRAEHLALGPSQRVSVLDKAPREFRSEFFNQALRVPAPEIHAHLVQETTRDSSFSMSAHATPQITYDYKSHHFLMPASAVAGTKSGSREVPVGGIDSHGKIGSFADGHSGIYAQSFARSEAAGSYRGGSFGSSGGRGGYGSGYSAGGHGSGYSSGSYSSGSHSSGSSSSGGSYSHSSGGGGGGGSSSSSSGSRAGSSSSSSGSSGGGSRGRP